MYKKLFRLYPLIFTLALAVSLAALPNLASSASLTITGGNGNDATEFANGADAIPPTNIASDSGTSFDSITLTGGNAGAGYADTFRSGGAGGSVEQTMTGTDVTVGGDITVTGARAATTTPILAKTEAMPPSPSPATSLLAAR